MYKCDVLNKESRLWTTGEFPPEYCVSWALSAERSLGYIEWINGWIKRRWKQRAKLMEMARDPGMANKVEEETICLNDENE